MTIITSTTTHTHTPLMHNTATRSILRSQSRSARVAVSRMKCSFVTGQDLRCDWRPLPLQPYLDIPSESVSVVLESVVLVWLQWDEDTGRTLTMFKSPFLLLVALAVTVQLCSSAPISKQCPSSVLFNLHPALKVLVIVLYGNHYVWAQRWVTRW